MATQDDASTASPLPPPPPGWDQTVATAQAQVADLQLQESVVAQVLDVLDEAGRQVCEGAPRWVDPDVFGGSRRGERMARHTLRAQDRVHQALAMATEALAGHHVALATFRDDVRRVEAQAEEHLVVVRARVEGVSS
ncbi:MAG: hypothetical protein JWN84_4371 [Nocardioides sp.]|nr:hypothetical protein [Nocardioides sp.]